jgi:hypothetical protein
VAHAPATVEESAVRESGDLNERCISSFGSQCGPRARNDLAPAAGRSRAPVTREPSAVDGSPPVETGHLTRCAEVPRRPLERVRPGRVAAGSGRSGVTEQRCDRRAKQSHARCVAALPELAGHEVASRERDSNP